MTESSVPFIIQNPGVITNRLRWMSMHPIKQVLLNWIWKIVHKILINKHVDTTHCILHILLSTDLTPTEYSGLNTRSFNTVKPRPNGPHLPGDIFKCIFLNENVSISITFSLKFIPKGAINNIPALVNIMAWRRPCDKPLSEPMVVSLRTSMS